ncbi:hypothetical protein OIU76_025796 [Salix suchowensis]|nr:hypothetical protein OIU76_025796 [Salix suchowensis]
MASPKSVNILDICMFFGELKNPSSEQSRHASLRPRPSTLVCLSFVDVRFGGGFFDCSAETIWRLEVERLVLVLSSLFGSEVEMGREGPIFAYHSSNDAVSFTVAESDDDFDRLAGNGIRKAADSHPYSPQLLATETKAPLLALQVTLFPNKGFCIGMETHHAMFDGKSASMFFRAWAYTCKYIVEKGEAPLLFPEDITPSFDWSTIKDSEGLEEVYLNLWVSMGKKLDSGLESNPRSVKPFSKLDVQPNLLRATFHLTTEDIKKLRESVLNYHHPAETDPTERLNLSTYVLACSYASVCQVKARGGDTDREVYFVWSADCRSRLDPPLPPNHFGDTVLIYHIVCKAGDFMQENGVAIIAKKLSDSIKRMEKGLLEGSKERLGLMLSLGAEVQQISVSGSTGIQFYNTNFGWGNIVKVELSSIDRAGSFSVMDAGTWKRPKD